MGEGPSPRPVSSTSPTTPTTRTHGTRGFSGFMDTIDPTASPPGQYRLAAWALTTATASVEASSVGLRKRPSRRGGVDPMAKLGDPRLAEAKGILPEQYRTGLDVDYLVEEEPVASAPELIAENVVTFDFVFV